MEPPVNRTASISGTPERHQPLTDCHQLTRIAVEALTEIAMISGGPIKRIAITALEEIHNIKGAPKTKHPEPTPNASRYFLPENSDKPNFP